MSQLPTLTQHLIDQRRRFPEASGDFNSTILEVALACKAISRAVACASLAGAGAGLPGLQRAGTTDAIKLPGETPVRLDALSNDVFLRRSEWGGQLAGMASAGMARPYPIPPQYARGKYLLVFDPLEGCGNIELNVPVGSIFSVLRAPEGAQRPSHELREADFMQGGERQVAAGYAIYGPATMLVLTAGNGVAGFTLDPGLGEFMLTHPDLRVPCDTREFAIDAANNRFWEAPVKRYVDECLAGREGPRATDFSMRWTASLVAEAHRILMRGGVFLHPRDGERASPSGRRRLLYEANPIGFIMEQAGARASTGRERVLEVLPESLHQRTPLIFGSRNEVERIERYHAAPVARDFEAPLFAERSLFRA